MCQPVDANFASSSFYPVTQGVGDAVLALRDEIKRRMKPVFGLEVYEPFNALESFGAFYIMS